MTSPAHGGACDTNYGSSRGILSIVYISAHSNYKGCIYLHIKNMKRNVKVSQETINLSNHYRGIL
jgi:hypothetical protein